MQSFPQARLAPTATVIASGTLGDGSPDVVERTSGAAGHFGSMGYRVASRVSAIHPPAVKEHSDAR